MEAPKTKVCTKCGEEFPATTEYFHKLKTSKYGLNGRCKKCRSNIFKERYHNDSEYRSKVNEYNAERKREMYRNDPRYRKYGLDLSRKKTLELSPSYIACSIGIPLSDLTPEMIETKRLIIQLKRELGLTHSSKKERNINNKYQKQWKQKEI